MQPGSGVGWLDQGEVWRVCPAEGVIPAGIIGSPGKQAGSAGSRRNAPVLVGGQSLSPADVIAFLARADVGGRIGTAQCGAVRPLLWQAHWRSCRLGMVIPCALMATAEQ